jgi:hypothetical protein
MTGCVVDNHSSIPDRDNDFSGELYIPDNNEQVPDEPTAFSFGPQGIFASLHCTAYHLAKAMCSAHLHSTRAETELDTCSVWPKISMLVPTELNRKIKYYKIIDLNSSM